MLLADPRFPLDSPLKPAKGGTCREVVPISFRRDLSGAMGGRVPGYRPMAPAQATSADGTEIPFVCLRPIDAHTAPPTLVYAYGGEQSRCFGGVFGARSKGMLLGFPSQFYMFWGR